MGNVFSMNKAGAGMAIAIALSTSAFAQNNGPASMGGAPAMPKAVAPQPMEGQGQNSYIPVGSPSSSTSDADQEAKHRNLLRDITVKKAELDLLKVEAEVANFKKPQEEAAKKEEAAGLQAALEQAKKEHATKSPTMSGSGLAPVDLGPPVLLLATFGSPDIPHSGYAEFKVGDLIVHAKVGDRLPSGHYLKAVHFDSVEISKSKKSKAGKTVYISPGDTASVYGSRAKSGASVEPAGQSAANGQNTGIVSPNGLPPMPGNR